MDEKQKKHRLNIADIITFFRIAGTIMLYFLTPLTTAFFILYSFTGLTDVLDGWVARKTKTASDFGAKLDGIADLLFYVVIFIRVMPELLTKLPNEIWYVVAAVFCMRISAYTVAAIKYRQFASLHTYLNKFTGIIVFFIPFSLIMDYAAAFCWIVSAVAAVAALEELIIQIRSKNYCPNVKSIFMRKK